MEIIEEVRRRMRALCNERGVDPQGRVEVRPLSPDEAIGEKADGDFVIKKGRERVIEAVFEGARGQAFTDAPSRWAGPLTDILALDLTSRGNRAVFVAAINAVLRRHGKATGTLHCLDEDPSRCGQELASSLEQRFDHARVGLIGLQPAILAGLVAHFGRDLVRVVDLNADNIGTERSGVEVWNGETDLPRLVDWCQVGLATGSAIVNGSIEDIRARFETAGKPLVFFGNTISGAAALVGLDRLCPFGR